ncbi:uncharacterized protein LOC103512379, partial [Diaphorina citri]|uniref:Uncharacterized protein LOC103512379 n=1 Tax=Diaphorina citri TaxID=121845 RepID=A0A3Q0J4N4_DIACI
EPNNPLTIRSLWDWGEQFSDRDILLFDNPLYNPANESNLLSLDCVALPQLQLWAQCYFRYIPQLELVGGGSPQVEFIARQALLGSYTLEDLCPEQVGSFYPFTQWRSHVGSTPPPPNPLLMSTLSLNTSGGEGDEHSYCTGITD